MAYKCPRCGEKVQRGYSGSAQIIAGLAGALFYAAFGSFVCKKCGKIPNKEFPEEDRRKMLRGTLILVFCSLAIFVLAIWLIVAFS